MASEVDELFGDGSGIPKPRTTRVLVLLISGVILAIAGLACSAAPGGVLVLMAWMTVEKEMDRVDNGYFPAHSRPTVQRLRAACYGGLVLIILTFIVQAWLFARGFYEAFWGQLIHQLAA